MRHRPCIPNPQRGGALLIAVLAAAVAALVALALVERGQGAMARTEAVLAAERSYQYALGMDALAMQLLEQAAREGIDPAALDGQWTAPFEVPGGMIQGRLIDQSARFNLNSLAHPDAARSTRALESFRRLLLLLELDPVIAVELVDWLDPAATPRPGSVGDAYYARRQPAYRTAGRPLAHVSELRWLRSVDDEVLARLLPHVTVLPAQFTRININSTSPPVLASLTDMLDLDQARRVVDDGPYGDLEALARHPLIQPVATPAFRQDLMVTSEWYLAHARVVLDGIERDYYRLMSRTGSGYDFRYFSQGVP